jgi:hypothetical protein
VSFQGFSVWPAEKRPHTADLTSSRESESPYRVCCQRSISKAIIIYAIMDCWISIQNSMSFPPYPFHLVLLFRPFNSSLNYILYLLHFISKKINNSTPIATYKYRHACTQNHARTRILGVQIWCIEHCHVFSCQGHHN